MGILPSPPAGCALVDGPFPRDLELNVRAELHQAESSQAAEVPVERWLFDPAEAQRAEVGLRSLLGAVESLSADPPSPVD